MKRLLYIIFILLSSLSFVQSSSTESIQIQLYDAYISGNTNKWVDGMNHLEHLYTNSGDNKTLFELTVSQYGYIGSMIDKGEIDKAKILVPKTEKNIDKLLKSNSDWPEAHALKAGIYGFKIILYPTYKIIYGPRGKESMEKASELNQHSPSVVVQMANYKYHSPALLGGDVDEAIIYYQKAIQLFESSGLIDNNWQYVNAFVWLAISYDKNGESEKALSILQDILVMEPDFLYVKNELYPQINANIPIAKEYLVYND